MGVMILILMNTLTWIVVFTSLGYVLFVVIIVRGLKKIRTISSTMKPMVSVVIAARNESRSIGECLTSLMEQDYDPGLYEVIVADDQSTDGTQDILARFTSAWNSLKVISIHTVPADVSPKKHALVQAIDSASGDIILQTDADCIVPPTWITGMVSRFGKGIDMVTGMAPYFAGHGMLNSFIRHEYLWNCALSAGSITLGHGTHASGRNLAFRKDVFDSIGGYGDSLKILSGDDTLLLHRIQKVRPGGIVTNTDPSSHVYSRAPGDLMSFFLQRVRHMSTGRYFDPVLIITGAVVYGFHIGLLVSLALSIVSSRAALLFAGGFILKLGVDCVAAFMISRTVTLEVQWSKIIINELLLVIYMSIIPLAALWMPVPWKEKELKKRS